MIQFTFDKTAISVHDLDDQENDLAYWLSRSPEERLAAVEFMRRTMYGYDPAQRMERVLEIDDLK